MHKPEDRMIKGYRDLLVWQTAHELAKEVITHSGHFPLTDEASIIKKQIIRSAISVPANIAIDLTYSL